MGTSNSPEQFAAKFGKLAQDLSSNKAAMIRVAMSTKGEFEKALDRAGVDGTTPVTRSIRVRDDVKGDRNATAIVRYTGPAHLINNDTSRHFIGARKLGTRKSLAAKSAGVGAVTAFGGSASGAFGSLRSVKRGAKALTIGSNLRAYAFHPGTRGKRFFQDARARSTKSAPETFQKAQLNEPLKRIFGL